MFKITHKIKFSNYFVIFFVADSSYFLKIIILFTENLLWKIVLVLFDAKNIMVKRL